MDNWKREFIGKLEQVRQGWVEQFDEKLTDVVAPVYEDLADFLRDHGFRTAAPLQEPDRRSFKFELTEDTYLLMIFRFTGAGSFELRSESYASSREPTSECVEGRLTELGRDSARAFFEQALDAFVERLAHSREPAKELAAV